jgi:hypothetical protein
MSRFPSNLADGNVQIVSPDLYAPSIDAVKSRLSTSALIRINQRLREPSDELPYDDRSRVAKRAKYWLARRHAASGIDKLREERDRDAISALALTGARLAGPATEHAAEELIADIHAAAPWLSEVTSYFLRHLRDRLRSGDVGLVLPPVLLVGNPGVSKSWLARELGRLGELPVRQIDVGAGSAGFRIAGTEKGWGTASSGLPVETIMRSQIANPMMVVDEIDKAGVVTSMSGSSTSIITSMLQLLERSTASVFECPHLRLGFDLSHVNWVLTANEVKTISQPLLDRVRVFRIPDLTLPDLLYHFDRVTGQDEDRDIVSATRQMIIAHWRSRGSIGLRQVNRAIAIMQRGSERAMLN